jgi:hypothetical protein
VRLLARLVAVVGAVALGAYLLRAAPRDVVLVYDLAAPGAPAVLEVEIRRGDEVVRRSELTVPASGGQVSHPVRLVEGDYAISWRLSGPLPSHGRVPLEVREEGTVVLPLRP